MAKRTRNTWKQQYETAKQSKDFNPQKFAGRITAERLAIAEKAIRGIGSPLLSADADFDITDKAVEYIQEHLQNAVDKLVSELKAGKRSTVKTTDVVPF